MLKFTCAIACLSIVLPTLCVARYVNSAPQQRYNQNNEIQYEIPILRQSNINDGDGTYSYSYETADGIKMEEHSTGLGNNQVVQGSFSYIGPEGRQYTLTYTADESGFHAAGDHLPTPPPIPEAILKSLNRINAGSPLPIHSPDSVVVEADRRNQQGINHRHASGYY